MPKKNQNTIMSATALQVFESQLAHIGVEGQAPASPDQDILPTINDSQISLSEERAWMLHQHNPLAASGPLLLAFKLKGIIDLQRLTTAIEQLYQGDSNLNYYYQLNDAGILEKIHQLLNPAPIEHYPVSSDQAAINYLLQQISQPMDLSRHPAIKFILMPQSKDEVIIGILGHHILLDDNAWKPIFTALSHFYQQEIQVLPQATPIRISAAITPEACLTYWQNQYPTGMKKTPLPDLWNHTTKRSINIFEYGKESFIAQPHEVVRFYSTVAANPIVQLSDMAQSSVFHTLLTLFGRYLNALLNKNSVDILIPIVKHRNIHQLNAIIPSSNVIPITVTNSEEGLHTCITNVRNNVLNGMTHNIPIEQILSITKTLRLSGPNILFTQFADAVQYLKIDNCEVQSLGVPPLSSDYDITLAFQINKNGIINLELTTGAFLSKTIGAFLLERFIIFLEDYSLDPRRIETPNTADNLENATNNIANNIVDTNAPPLTEKQQKTALIILDVFKTVLNIPDLTIHDHFFDHGGHSLLATRVIGKLQAEHGLLINIIDFFNAPIASSLAQYASNVINEDSAPPIKTMNQVGMSPLSLFQQTYLNFFEFGRNPIFNIPFALRFSEPVNEAAFRLAFLDLLERHHVLRTIFFTDTANESFQNVLPMHTLAQYPWFWFSSEQGQKSYQTWLTQEANHCFDLMQQLPIRIRFLIDDQKRSILSLLVHHCVMDEWSTVILINELMQAYESRIRDNAPIWHSIPEPFYNYALAQDQKLRSGENLHYWRTTLGKIYKCTPLFQTADQWTHPKTVDYSGAFTSFILDGTIAAALQRIAKTNKASLFHVVYAAIALGIYFLGAGKKILIGTSVSGHEDPKYQNTIGYFTKMLMYYTTFTEEMSINALILQVRDTIFDSLPYSEVPFGILETTIRAAEETSQDNLFEVYIQMHAKNSLTGTYTLHEGQSIDFELLELERKVSNHGIHFEIYEEPLSFNEAIRGMINYRTSHYSATQMELIKNTCENVLRIIAATENQQAIDVRGIRKRLAQIGRDDLTLP